MSEPNWRNFPVVITGATGMVGANLVERLVGLGNRPLLLVRDPVSLGRIGHLAGRVQVARADVADVDSIKAALAGVAPAVVYHLAGSFFSPPTLSAHDHILSNTLGTLNVCEALKGCNPATRMVYAGSCASYAGGSQLREDMALDPGSMFGVSKAAGSMVARTFGRLAGFEVVELRLFGPFGPYENARRLIPDTILTALDGREVSIGEGSQQRDFVFMDDVIDAFLLAAYRPLPPGLVVNIASGIGRPIRDVVRRVLELMGNPTGFRTGVRPTRPDEIWEISGDIAAAQTYLGWKPQISFDEGICRTISWFRKNRAIAGILN